MVGDSLSAAHNIPREAGWVALLRERVQTRCAAWKVVNASISGETSAGGRERLPELLERHQPDVVVLELGANDGLRAVPPAVLRRNLRAMIETAHDAGAAILLAGIRLPKNYGPLYRERFEAVFSELADAHDVALLPRLLADVAERPELIQDDGLHPRAGAQQRILANVWPELAPLLSTAGCQSADAGTESRTR